MKIYVLERKDVKGEYFNEVDFGYEIMTFNLSNAKVFYRFEDAERFNENYLHNKYEIKELEHK